MLRLELLGRDTVAGRPVRLERGVPRREARRLSTFRLDFDADEIELAVDLERALLLRRTLRIDGGDYAVLEVRELELDATFPGDTFRPRADARRRQHVRAEELTVEEAASRASFPVWAPAALVEWELEARYYPGDKAGQEPESVHFHLWRAAGHQIHVEQTAAETVDRSSRSHAWELLERAGERFDVIEPEDRNGNGNEASVRLIRDVTETTSVHERSGSSHSSSWRNASAVTEVDDRRSASRAFDPCTRTPTRRSPNEHGPRGAGTSGPVWRRQAAAVELPFARADESDR